MSPDVFTNYFWSYYLNYQNQKMTEITNNEDRKPSFSLWGRIVSVIVCYILLAGIFQFVVMSIANINPNELADFKDLNVTQHLILNFLGFLPMIFIVFIFRKYVDNQSIKSMGFSLKNRLVDFVMGFAIAIVVIGFGTFILNALNFIEITSFQFDSYSLSVSFLLFVIVALNEELLFRAYILNNLMSSMNKYYALLLSSVIFSLFHSLNFNLSLIAIVNLILAGILLGSTYIFTKNIWFPVSLHLFWNFFQGPIIGYAVSGQKIASLYNIKLAGNNYINGGDFGFEGSIICTALVVITIVFIFRYFYNKTSRKSLLTLLAQTV